MAARQQKKPSNGNDDKPAIWAGYGKLVRLFRDKAGLTQQALAEAVGYSYEQVASIEQGRRPAKAAFTEAAERALGAGGVLAALQSEVERAKLPTFFQDFALLEAEALSRFSYDALLVPGLLQTERYGRALFRAHYPPLSDDAVERLTDARLARQALLRRTTTSLMLVFIVEESALRRLVGDKETMAGQYEHLLEAAGLRNVEIQIMPTSRGAHSGLNGSMVLLETQDRRQVVYIESQDVVSVLSERPLVSEFWLRYGMLRTQALDTEASADLIKQVAEEL
ncbi:MULTISPECIES: helix-turn-helix transcriptional regulator [Streptomyces]|uniref:helix-turn-helix domain-containing protein n=1 Tax=Streptomyces TaxID=1883 RepID=UPI001CCFBD71|nr:MULTISPECIES: helix-turn-helix transcriptional regulator [Streptomyces]MBZ6141890.1 helix-turn-helix transcriptional regulator [Streptomyces olivaceus]MBZ6165880.1 helix-turn-helix transcriptional regulator [Streptomyces olivaceus]MBZ6174547.1 helix-turn-helix transcriptional regulator [Streptomyces olivaceus]MBZ6180726.1 helix-turn-helix transcriptional regulator [Streptomyces olivaceus]WFB85340.1 helix-turn-helix transcriptional regulator [Streptomyces olivaceus]